MPDAVPANSSRRGLKIALIVVIVVLGFSFLINLGLIATVAGGGGGADLAGPRPYRTQAVEGRGEAQILIVDVHGEISDRRGGGLIGETVSLVDRVTSQLKQAARDPNVRAVVLSVDSPGGGVTASDALRHEVMNLQKAGKKVVVHMGDLCASGGYYLSAPADVIIASPTTITGSIGVILPLADLHGLLEGKLGIAYTPIKSGPYKDIASMTRPLEPAERKILQDLVNEMYERFVGVVVEGRQGHGPFATTSPEDTKAAVKTIADGRVYTSTQAVTNGLADEVGYLDDAIARAKALCGINEATVIRYHREQGLLGGLLGAQEKGITINAGMQLGFDVERMLSPALEYRWYPSGN